MASRLNDLLAKKAELEQQIISIQREERASAIAQVKALMAQHGLSLADLGNRTTTAAPKGRSGGKVPAKYRDRPDLVGPRPASQVAEAGHGRRRQDHRLPGLTPLFERPCRNPAPLCSGQVPAALPAAGR